MFIRTTTEKLQKIWSKDLIYKRSFGYTYITCFYNLLRANKNQSSKLKGLKTPVIKQTINESLQS